MDFLRNLNNFCLAKINKQVIPPRWGFKRYGRDYMVKMLDTYQNLSQKDIEDFETSNSIELTDNYKEFLLKWNGGIPSPSTFIITEERSEERRVGKECRCKLAMYD